ncbi:hypothetical protein K3181_07680 [Qipengyuania sp. YG27]|uniref:Uncharacterized protein n=1 Tax=Qipengyuania mesophila TaxID=2867246 RepID=A0ABS7JUI4_9SPHN|nr:hypothetical protein [Qipengyuania mesophila]MBX7501319.1 hypothetical protein [Qipengyuania mesophila]
MKPASIKMFDWLFLGSLGVTLLGILLNFGTLSAQAETEFAAQGLPEMGTGMLIGALLLSLAISLGLWFLISVLRIGLARWALVLLTAWSILTTAKSLELGFDSTMAWGLLATVMTVAAIWFLFRPDARAWFAGTRGESGE